MHEFLSSITEPETAVLLSARFAALSMLVVFWEDHYDPGVFRPGGILDWRVLAAQSSLTAKGLCGDALNVAFHGPFFKVVMLLSLGVCAGAVFLPGSLQVGFIPLALLALVSSFVRCPYGANGAMQMSFVVLASASIAVLVGTSLGYTVAAAVIAFQICLAYFVSGISKFVSQSWRTGWALRGVMGTRIYGNRWLSGIIERNAAVALVSCWAVILLEMTFPFFGLFSVETCLAIMLVGLVFHVANAIIMGLNTFLISFVGAYPALLSVASLLAQFEQRGDITESCGWRS